MRQVSRGGSRMGLGERLRSALQLADKGIDREQLLYVGAGTPTAQGPRLV
jgi:hypothetical protein